MEHTPGPWVGWFKQATTAAAPPSCGRIVGPPWVETKEASGYSNQQDVFLMAAAPELLDACKRMVEEIRERLAQEGIPLSDEPKSHYSGAFNAMLNAIKKAEVHSS